MYMLITLYCERKNRMVRQYLGCSTTTVQMSFCISSYLFS